MTDKEINEDVARKLGWTDLFLSPNIGRIDIAGKKRSSDTFNTTVPDYCTSINAAWEIVEFMNMGTEMPEFQLTGGKGLWVCQIGNKNGFADTAPMAICLAFLKPHAAQ